MKTDTLLERHHDVWLRATRHPFLDAVRDGTLPAGVFASWLAQDYLFVGDLLVFQARLLSRAPRCAQAVLAGGLVALEAELSWFEAQAAQRSLPLKMPRHPITVAYQDALSRLEHEPYPAAITALWAVEAAYLEAWRSAAPGHEDYRPFVEHWTVPAFADYVAGLARATSGEPLSGEPLSGEKARGEVEAAFLEVARLEHDFWEMAWTQPA